MNRRDLLKLALGATVAPALPLAAEKKAPFTIGERGPEAFVPLPSSRSIPINERSEPCRCVFDFKSKACGYQGTAFGSCDKTISDCRDRGQQERFCGLRPDCWDVFRADGSML